jgi:putative flavoprotein involved in K+ transport
MTDTASRTATDTSTPARPDHERPHRVSTVIVGAGQAGLGTAYFLSRAGHDCIVLERHARVGDQWRHRYDSLVLNTPARNSGLPGHRFPGPAGDYPTARALADHHEEYVDRFGLSVACGVTVRSVDRQADGGWLVATERGSYEAENVVIATGGETHPKTPDLVGRIDPGIRQIHSSEYRNPGQLLPGPVLVVGLGQSGADIALELAQAGREVHTSGAVRQEIPVDIASLRGRIGFRVLWFLWNRVLTDRTPPGRKLKAGIRSGMVTAPLVRVKRKHLDEAGVQRHDARTTDAVGGRPGLEDGTVLDVANVIWCTGFGQDFSFIHPSPVGEDGWPRERGGVVEDLPGLYFMGLLFQRGFYSMLVGGAGRDARFIAHEVLRRQRVSSPSGA